MLSVIPHPIQGLMLMSLAGGIYVLTFRLNELFDSWALFGQGISLIFLPAGIKHLAILLTGKWGALGCLLATYILASEFWANQSTAIIALYALISTASTWAAIVLSLRGLGISTDLKNLKFMHLPLIDLITTAAHGFTTNTYFILAGMKSENFLSNALAMMFGDFVGSFVLLTLLWLGLSIWRRPWKKPYRKEATKH
ncbi:MAG: hypothetical protein FJY36_01350 [Betaproteobacteria bacterium]|nr:hypothetical protein [Betaproteobacteria bacterium]